jgi:hypothetical protein
MEEGIMIIPRKMSEVVLGGYFIINLLCIIIFREFLGVYIAFQMQFN